MRSWKTILSEQLSDNPHRLSVEDATILYEEADINDLMYASLERRKKQVPGNIVTYLVDRNINYTNICTINCAVICIWTCIRTCIWTCIRTCICACIRACI